jgi:hypothetical protein
MEGRSIALYELVQAFKALTVVYSNFTRPILNTLAEGLEDYGPIVGPPES